MGVCTGIPSRCHACSGPRCPIDTAWDEGRIVPANNAARRAQGLAEDPNEPKNPDSLEYADYLLRSMPGRTVPDPLSTPLSDAEADELVKRFGLR